MMFPKTYRKSKRSKARASMPESVLQKQCEDYLDALDIAYIRIPDAMNSIVFGSKSIPVHVKVMIAAFTKGVPDITVLYPDGRYVCCEMKTEIGKQSQSQKDWSRRVSGNYHIVRSFEDFKSIIGRK